LDRSRFAVGTFLLGNGISLTGNTFALVALPWFVIETTGSAARTGVAGMISALPALAAGLIGGVLVDRFGGRLMSIVSDIVSGLAVLLIPLLHETIGLNYGTLLVLIFLGALLDVPGITARRTLLPDLAQRAGWRDERMNAAFENSQGGALIIGPLIAGVLASALGTVNLLWFTGASFAVSAVAIALCAPAGVHRDDDQDEPEPGILAPMMTGLRYVARDPLLLTLALSLAMMNFLVTPFWSVVMPVLMDRTFGEVSRLGLLITLFGIGNLVGGTVYGWIGHRIRQYRRGLYLLGAASFAAYLWLIVVEQSYPLLAVGGLVMGALSGPINPLLVTLRMERIPKHLRGRVFASFSGLTGLAIPLGMLFAGWVLQVAGATRGMQIFSGVATAMVVCLLALPVLREMNDHPEDTETAAPKPEPRRSTEWRRTPARD
jgi:MFS family permease